MQTDDETGLEVMTRQGVVPAGEGSDTTGSIKLCDDGAAFNSEPAKVPVGNCSGVIKEGHELQKRHDT